MIIALDAMGGDNAPQSVVDGCKQYLKENPGDRVRLFGKAEVVAPLIEGSENIELIDCPEVIDMEEEPMLAVRRKQNSSLMRGLKDVKEGASAAFVSAGSTGALFLGSMVTLRLLKGIPRPALAPVLPGTKGPFLLIDSGANADCQPEYLEKFGLMGAAYMSAVMGVKNPRVGLVNIGVEDVKGSKLYRDAFGLMKAQGAYNFAGNCEAREIQKGEFDVVVADGFTGNVILKYAEGFAGCLMHEIKAEVMSSLRGKLGGLLLKPAFANIKRKLNTEEYGGAPLVGVNGVVVKAHGSSGAYAIKRTLEQAHLMVEGGLTDKIRQGLETTQLRTKENEQ